MEHSPLAPLQHFYRTVAHPCPYLPGLAERKIITELAGPEIQSLYNNLSRAGFRRSHLLAYRPTCHGCSACIPVRIPVRDFMPSRTQRRLMLRNSDLIVGAEPAQATAEHFHLFSQYQTTRHADGEMASMDYRDFRSMVNDTPVATALITLRSADAERLVGACLIDVLDDGLSAVYSYYAPDLDDRSIGTTLVLTLIDRARALGLPYVYLGYWVPKSRKMAYKAKFKPLEALGAQGWAPLDAAAIAPTTA